MPTYIEFDVIGTFLKPTFSVGVLPAQWVNFLYHKIQKHPKILSKKNIDEVINIINNIRNTEIDITDSYKLRESLLKAHLNVSNGISTESLDSFLDSICKVSELSIYCGGHQKFTGILRLIQKWTEYEISHYSGINAHDFKDDAKCIDITNREQFTDKYYDVIVEIAAINNYLKSGNKNYVSIFPMYRHDGTMITSNLVILVNKETNTVVVLNQHHKGNIEDDCMQVNEVVQPYLMSGNLIFNALSDEGFFGEEDDKKIYDVRHSNLGANSVIKLPVGKCNESPEDNNLGECLSDICTAPDTLWVIYTNLNGDITRVELLAGEYKEYKPRWDDINDEYEMYTTSHLVNVELTNFKLNFLEDYYEYK